MQKLGGLLVVAMSMSIAGCASRIDGNAATDDSVGQVTSKLFGATGLYWPISPDGVTRVPVCWEFDGYEVEKQNVRGEVEGQWGSISSVQFEGWDRCDASHDPNSVRVWMQDAGPHANVGTAGNGTDVTLNFLYANWPCSPAIWCNGVSAVHEFGHALGLYHEQQRPDNEGGRYCNSFDGDEPRPISGGQPLGSYDVGSIMGYCSEWARATPVLSDGDRAGIVAIYGVTPSRLREPAQIYSGEDFLGTEQPLWPGDYDRAALNIGDDALSSLRVPEGWTVALYRGSAFTGASKSFSANSSYVGCDFDDQTSSIRVMGPSQASAAQGSAPPAPAFVFSEANFAGQKQALWPGAYDVSKLTLGADQVSSIVVPAGWRVILYEDSAFGGRAKAFTADAPSLDEGFDDITSSIVVIGPVGA